MATSADIKIMLSALAPATGWLFSTKELSGAIHELFGPISPTQARDGYTDYRLIAIYNNHTVDPIDGAKIYVSSETTSPGTTIEIGIESNTWAVAPPYSPAIPSIGSVTTPPAGITFYPAASFAAALSLGTLGIFNSITCMRIVWIKRIVTAGASALPSDFGTITVTNRV